MAFSSPLSPQPPTTFTYLGQAVAGGSILGGVLVGDYVDESASTPPGSAYNLPVVTEVTGVPVSAQLELQSTTGAFLVMRMTTTQRNALVTVVDGMMIFNVTTGTFQFYQGSAWVSLSAGAGGVVGPASSTDNAIVTWNGAGGTDIQDSVVILDPTGNISGVEDLALKTLNVFNAAATFSVTIEADAALAADYTLTLPLADATPNANAVVTAVPLSSDGAGALSFVSTGLIYAAGVLTLAEILDAYNTPVALIDAPGAGFMNVIHSFGLEYVYGSAAYVGGGAAYLQYGATAHGTNYATPVTAIPAALLTGLAASTAILTTGTINTTTGLAVSVAGNAAITYTNASAAFTVGTGGSARWYVWYSVVPIT